MQFSTTRSVKPCTLVTLSRSFVALILFLQVLTQSLALRFPAFLEEDDGLDAVLCEFDAVIEDFTSPVEKRHFRYDEHLKTMKRRSSASVSDSGISDAESEYAGESSFYCSRRMIEAL